MGTEICVGGGQHAASSYATTPQAYVSGFGFAWNPLDPFAGIYALIFSQYRPTNQKAGGAWDALAEACMRTRNMLFCNNTPDDCGAASKLGGMLGTLRTAAGLGVSGVSAGLSIATAAGASVSSVAGAVIPGVGAVLSTVLAIYQKHVAAESLQEGTLCSECPAVTQVMQQIDAAVASGSASPEQGYSAMAQLSTQFTGALSGIFKSGNAADGYERIFKCQVALSLYLYGISPLPPNLSSGTVFTSESDSSATNQSFSAGSNESDEAASYEVPSASILTTPTVTAAATATPATSIFGNSFVIILAILIGIVLIWGASI